MAYSRTLNHFTSMQELATIWASSTSYVVNQLVINSNKLYRCLIAHTSTASFATDLGAGNWVEVSASASGVKNYISNGNFENSSTTGWNLARSTLDATTKLPNQASGSWAAAAGTLSRTIVTSGQLSGVASLSLASSAATTAGDMLVTDALTLDLEAQASVQTFSFYYRVTSGAANGNFSGTSSNSIGVAIYVVDGALAGTWIQPAGVWSVNTASSVTAITAKAAGTFQVPSDATQVRLAVYFPNATTGAITVYLDDFVLGPQVVQYGAPVTDWQAYTPTFTGFGTVATQAFWWRRVGDSVQIKGRLVSGTSTATEARIGLPGITSAGSDKIATIELVGTAEINQIGGVGQNVGVSLAVLAEQSVGYVTFSARSSGNTGLTKLTGTNVSPAGAVLVLEAQVPILGWSSSVQMSNDTDTRVVAAKIYQSSAQALTAGAVTKATNMVAEIDSHGAWNSGTARWVAPVPGYYRVSAVTSILTGATTERVTALIYKNGSVAIIAATTGNTVGSAAACPSGIVSLNAGDYLELYVSLEGASRNTNPSAAGFYYAIERLTGPSAIAASETVAALYWASVNGTATTATPYNFDSREVDTHGAVTTGAAWRFTAPIAGLYLVGLHGNTTVSVAAYSMLYKNGTAYKVIGYGGTAETQKGYGEIRLNAGEYIEIRPTTTVQYKGGALNDATGSANIFITRVGN